LGIKDMLYKEGGIVTAKKPHACGGFDWQILRTGADVKLKCLTCGRIYFFSVDQVDKMKKKYSSGEEDARK